MLFANNPFKEAVSTDGYYRTLVNNSQSFFEFFEEGCGREISAEAKDLLTSMLNPNPLERPSCEEIERSDWYNGETASDEEVLHMMAEVISRRE